MEQHDEIIQQPLEPSVKVAKESSNEDEEKTMSFTEAVDDTRLEQDEQPLYLDFNETRNGISTIKDSRVVLGAISGQVSNHHVENYEQTPVEVEEQITVKEQKEQIGKTPFEVEVEEQGKIPLKEQIGLPSSSDYTKSTVLKPSALETDRNPNDISLQPLDPILIKEQFKAMTKIINSLKKRKDAFIFLNPVDPVALKIPTYFSVITHPMDISTVERKLHSHAYATVDDAIDDLNLMLNNCFTFNGHESAVALIGKACQTWLNKEFEKIPRSLLAALAAVQKKRPGRPSDIHGRSSLLAREEIGKRRLAATVAGQKSTLEVKFLAHIHKEFYKKAHQAIVWPFLNPVDPVALNIPTYFTIIKYPMDLSTMKKKIDTFEYTSVDEYEADFRLMLENCYKFNGAGSDIYNIGKQVESLLNYKLAERHPFMDGHSEIVPKPQSGYTDNDDDDDEDEQQIKMVKTQLSLLNEQLQLLKEKQRKKKQRRSASATSASSNVAGALDYFSPHVGTRPTMSSSAMTNPKSQIQSKPKKGAKRGRKKRAHVSSDDERMPASDISYEQKRELSDNINILPPEKLPEVFEIIKENADINTVDDEEFELDIDSLAKPVLWKLYLFVKRNTRPPKIAKYDHDNGDLGGDASSSSEAESADMDSESIVRHPKSSGGKLKSAAQSKKVSISKTTVMTSSSTIVKKSISPLPFRTEKGEITTYTSNFVTTSSNFSMMSKKPPPPKIPPKPQYDSVLDMAWDMHETVVVEPPKPVPVKKEPIAVEKPVLIARSPSPEREYIEPKEWLDLQGPADLVQEFQTNVLEAAALNETITLQVEQAKQGFFEEMKAKLLDIRPEEIFGNEGLGLGGGLDYADDEEGAVY